MDEGKDDDADTSVEEKAAPIVVDKVRGNQTSLMSESSWI